jgi:hypothetical protein
MSKYTITVMESATGNFVVTDVQKVVKINQHRTDTKRMATSAFGFATASDPQSLAKRATRRSR